MTEVMQIEIDTASMVDLIRRLGAALASATVLTAIKEQIVDATAEPASLYRVVRRPDGVLRIEPSAKAEALLRAAFPPDTPRH